MLIMALLFMLAGVSLLTISERLKADKRQEGRIRERFGLKFRDDLSPASLDVRPGSIVVGVHDPGQLYHLDGVRESSDSSKQDVVPVAGKPVDLADPVGCTNLTGSSAIGKSASSRPLWLRSMMRGGQ